MINGFILCMSFNFLSISNSIDINTQGLTTLCNNAEYLNKMYKDYQIDPFVYSSLIYYESRWQPNLKSNAGACGLSQVLHKYLKGISCKDLFDPKVSILYGAKSLSYWKKYKKNSIRKALKCYSTGYKCSYSSYSRRIIKLSKLIKHQYETIKKEIENG
jgi:soluble lytic murein transglycosylase-like protein